MEQVKTVRLAKRNVEKVLNGPERKQASSRAASERTRDRGGGGAGGAEAPPDYLTVTSKKDCFY